MDYKEKKQELTKKYEDQTRLISKVKGVDTGVAFDMLEAHVNRGGENPFINVDEFKKDWQKLIEE